MRGRWLALVAVASLALNVAVVGTYAYRTTRRHGHRSRFPGVRSEIRDSIGGVMRQAKPQIDRLSAERDRLQADVMELVGKPVLDEQKIDSLCREQGRVAAEMAMLVARNMHRVVQMLPATEREQFLCGPGSHMRRGPHMMRRFGPHRGGPEAPPEPDGD